MAPWPIPQPPAAPAALSPTARGAWNGPAVRTRSWMSELAQQGPNLGQTRLWRWVAPGLSTLTREQTGPSRTPARSQLHGLGELLGLLIYETGTTQSPLLVAFHKLPIMKTINAFKCFLLNQVEHQPLLSMRRLNKRMNVTWSAPCRRQQGC